MTRQPGCDDAPGRRGGVRHDRSQRRHPVAAPEIARDEHGFVVTGPDAADSGSWPRERRPFALETSVPGIFAIGDVRSGSVKRVVAGVGEGGMGIAFVHQYLALSSA